MHAQVEIRWTHVTCCTVVTGLKQAVRQVLIALQLFFINNIFIQSYNSLDHIYGYTTLAHFAKDQHFLVIY